MLSAQKEEIRLAAGATPDDLPNLGSFGKVVNSIQGLQQRLENFSADDVGAAHDRTQTLLFRLSYLQGKLATFAEIKVSMATVRNTIEQALRECTDVGKLDALEKHVPIQAFIQANKLIQFPRLNKSAKIPGTELALNADEAIRTRAQVHENDAPIPRVAEDSDKSDAGQSLKAINLAALNSQPAIQSEITAATVVGQENGPEDQPSSQVAELSSAIAFEPLLEPESDSSLADELQIDICDSAASGSYDGNTDARPHLTLPAATAHEEKTKDTVATTATTDFDQKLLDDLIKNYGEFAASRSSSRVIEIPDSPAVSTTEIHAASPTVRSTEIELERTNLPTVKRDGDLDRQLKKLIKDYGEYDLYSRQSPINLKTGVIAAFLLLALIFSGFYYFAPRAMSSQNSTPAQSGPSTSAGSSDHDSLADRPGATVAETGALRATENNSRLKSRP